jgi:hypothetical protein
MYSVRRSWELDRDGFEVISPEGKGTGYNSTSKDIAEDVAFALTAARGQRLVRCLLEGDGLANG